MKWKLLEQEGLFENCSALKELVFHSKEIDSLALMQNPFDFYQQMLLRQKKKKVFESKDKKISLRETGRLEMNESSDNWKVGLDFSDQERVKTVEARRLFEKIKSSNFKIKKDFRSLKTSMKSYKDFVDMKRENAHKRFKQALRAMEREEQDAEAKRVGRMERKGRGLKMDRSRLDNVSSIKNKTGDLYSSSVRRGSGEVFFEKEKENSEVGVRVGTQRKSEKDFHFDLKRVIGEEWKQS